MRLILSCEHATAAMPAPYAGLMAAARHLLDTHKGYDIGAMEVCRLVERLADGAFYGRCSRLLIDLNRSLRHPALFSEFSKVLPQAEKEAIVAQWYTPFRMETRDAVARTIERYGEVLHCSVHSFVEVLDGVTRSNDIGILYDPRRRQEKCFALLLARAIRTIDHRLSIRMNYPYRGVADGHTTSLRRCYDGKSYLGIELEINQRLLGDSRSRSTVGLLLAEALARTGVGVS